MSNLKFFKQTNNPAPKQSQEPPTPQPQATEVNPKYRPYVPNYVQMGVDPIKRESAWVPGTAPREEKKDKESRYQEIFEQISGSSSKDSFHLDNDLEQFGNVDMTRAMEQPNPYHQVEEIKPVIHQFTDDLVTDGSGFDPGSVDVNDYVLFVDNQPLASGSFEEIEELTSNLVFGRNHDLPFDCVEVERLSILKKIEIKMGLFLNSGSK